MKIFYLTWHVNENFEGGKVDVSFKQLTEQKFSNQFTRFQ